MSIMTDPRALRAHIIESLPAEARAVVDRVVAAAASAPLYVTAGALRDAILGRAARDIDLVVEGDAIAVARAAADGLRVTAHKRFGTATIACAATRVDVAMARSEMYARPGALPRVAPADIETDLRRRDFSINAMALRLDGQAALVDPLGGTDDLRAGRIRVLHDESFRDDATRIFRAFRYSSRLGFEIEPHTAGLLREGVRCVATIGGERLRRELELMFAEHAFDGLEACAASGALSAIHPALRWTPTQSQWLHDGKNINVFDETALGFALVSSNASADEAEHIIARLKLKREESAAVADVARLNAALPMLSRENVTPSGAVRILERYTDAAIGAFGGMNGETRAGAIAQQYLIEWKFVKPELDAGDLMQMGVPQGPRISQGLTLLRAARLDGTARDRDDERVLIARFAKSIRDSSAMTGTIELSANGH